MAVPKPGAAISCCLRLVFDRKTVNLYRNMTRTLYITDMDGTLLGTDSKVSAASASMLAELSRRGAMVTVATARTPATVVQLLRDCRLTVPAIVMTGAALWNWDVMQPGSVPPVSWASGGHFEDERYIRPEDMDTLDEVFAAAGVRPFRYVRRTDAEALTVFHAPEMSAAERAFYEQRARLFLKRFELQRVPQGDERRRCMLCFAMGAYDAVEEVGAAIARNTRCAYSLYPDTYDRSLGLLEIFGEGVSKAAAVNRLRCRMGAGRVVVFGDNLNDLPMMHCADVSVAVANALPEVRAAADIVIGPNSEDAVPRFIEADIAVNGNNGVSGL